MKKHKNQMYLIKILIALAVITGIIYLYLFYSSFEPSQIYINTKVSNENNSQAIKFNLKNQKGKAFSSKDLKGHLSLIYFGVIA